jgi:two-component system, cell cycle sensor histidine kinase and response regulator CckA
MPASEPNTARFGAVHPEELSQVLDLAHILVRKLDGTILFCTTGVSRLYGWSCEEMLGKPSHELLATEFPEPLEQINAELIAKGQWSGELNHRTCEGGRIWVASHWALHRDEAGDPAAVIEINNDITGRKLAEEAIRSAALFPEQNPSPVLRVHDDGTLLYANPSSYVLLGEWNCGIGQSVPGFLGEAVGNALARGVPIEIDLRGGDSDYAFLVVPIAGTGYANLYGRNVTQRRRVEQELRESGRLYRAIGESIDYGVWVCAPDGRNTYASESFLNLVGLTQEQCSNFGWGDVLHPDDAERTIAAWKECVRTEGRWDIEHRFRGVDGKWHPILARGVPVRDEEGRITCWAGINLDISALKRAEEFLRASERRERARAAEMEALMDAAPAAIFVAHDAGCRHMSGNRMVYDLLQRPPGSNLSKSAPEGEGPVNFRTMRGGVEIPAEELPIQRAASSGQAVRDSEMELVFEDGVSVSLLGDAVPLLDETGRPRGAVGAFIDITGRKLAERRLRESQKLESLGLLAGGVAHDFNNLLVGVIGNASLAQDMLPPDHPASELLERVVKTGEQAAHLTRQMLAYSGKGRFLVEALNLSTLIPDMSGLVRPSIPKKIALDLVVTEDLPAIEADRGQIQQVFMNLVLNAAEAIGGSEGLITVRTGVENVDARYIRRHPEAAELHPGDYVYLEVRDTGCGMDETTRAKIFDPFFTTKFAGRGLGLAAVAGIVRGHKGAIVVSSAPGKGSRFVALFPAAEPPVQEPPAASRTDRLRGVGVILVVDDEQVVRDMAKKALERRGYTVLLADSGLAAIDVLKRHPGTIALIVLDLSMPHMNGEEALPELRKIRPEVRIVISSGYSEAETMTLFRGQRVSGFIQKPYTSSGLAEKIRDCLA